VATSAACRSSGVQVARLADLPACINPVGQTNSRRVRRLAPMGFTPVGEALAAINPDELTPKEALEALYRLKGLGG
jgi:DNA mismatch repair protein MutS